MFFLARQEIEKDVELKNFIDNELGGWPIAEETNKSENGDDALDLIDFHRKIDAQGYSTDGLIHMSTMLDVFNSSRNVILVSPPSVSLNHEYLIRNSTDVRIRNYFNLIKEAIQVYNPNLKIDEQKIWKLINFEKQLSSLVS